MTLTKLVQMIQRLIWVKLIDLLDHNLTETELKRKTEELNEYVVMLLVQNQRVINTVLGKKIAEATNNIAKLLEREFGYQEAIDTTKATEKVVKSLNNNILVWLVASGYLAELYTRLSKQETTLDEVLELGLMSGYMDGRGNRWAIDRVAHEEEKRLFREIYFDAQSQAFEKLGIELVKVGTYAKPREACKSLQHSGVICIVPREQASQEAKQYPNIWDAEHRYMEPDGHHGINCRHVWHSIDMQSTSNDVALWRSVDKSKSDLVEGRAERIKLIS